MENDNFTAYPANDGQNHVDNTPRTYYNVGEKRHRKEKSPMNELHIC